MNQTELTIFIAVVLFIAFTVGWFLSWLLYRFTRVSRADVGELDRMAQALHEAEETRDQAILYLQHREAELNSQLTQASGQLKAATDGLRDARREVEELRAYIAKSERKH